MANEFSWQIPHNVQDERDDIARQLLEQELLSNPNDAALRRDYGFRFGNIPPINEIQQEEPQQQQLPQENIYSFEGKDYSFPSDVSQEEALAFIDSLSKNKEDKIDASYIAGVIPGAVETFAGMVGQVPGYAVRSGLTALGQFGYGLPRKEASEMAQDSLPEWYKKYEELLKPETRFGKKATEVIGKGFEKGIDVLSTGAAGLESARQSISGLGPKIPFEELKEGYATAGEVGLGAAGVHGLYKQLTTPPKPKDTPAWTKSKEKAPEAKSTGELLEEAKQAELELGYQDKFGNKPSEFALDENGIPINRQRSLELQTTERGGDLYERPHPSELTTEQAARQEAFREAARRQNDLPFEWTTERGAQPDWIEPYSQEVGKARAERPSIDFPLRQEALESDPVFIKLQQEYLSNQGILKTLEFYKSTEETINSRKAQLQKSEEALKDYLSRYGINKPEDAFGRKLYETEIPPELRGKQEMYGGFDLNRLKRDIEALGKKFPAARAIIENSARMSADSREMLEKVSLLKETKGVNRFHYFLGELADKMLENPNVNRPIRQIDSAYMESIGQPKAEAGYNSQTGEILVKGNTPLPSVMHEAVHGYTSAVIDIAHNPKLRKQLKPNERTAIARLTQAQRYFARTQKGKIGKDLYDVVSKNLKEFVTYGLTKNEFIEVLSNIPYQGKSLRTQFVDAIRQLFGFDKKVNSLFDALLTNTETLMGESKGVKSTRGKDQIGGRDQAVAFDLAKDLEVNPKGKENLLKRVLGKEYSTKTYDWQTQKPEILDVINKSPDLKGDLNFFEKYFASRGSMLGEILDNPGVRAGMDYIKGVTDFFQEKAEKSLFKQGGAVFDLNRIENLFGPGNARDVLLQRIAAKGNPEFKFEWKTKEQEALHAKIEKLFSDQLKEVNELRVADGKKPIKELPSYFGSLFDGSHYFTVKNSKGKPIAIVSSHNKWVAKTRRQLFKQQGISVDPIKRREALQGKYGSSEGKVAEYELMMDFLADESPSAVQARGLVEKMMQSEAAVAAGYHNRFKPWLGYIGSEGNKPWKSPSRNYYEAKNSLIRQVEAHNAWMSANKLADFAKEINEGKSSNIKMVLNREIADITGFGHENNIMRAIEATIEGVTGFDSQALHSGARKYSGAITSQFTGFGSMRALAQNFLQPLMAALPKMVELATLEGRGFDMLSPMIFGLKDFAEVLVRHQTNELSQFLSDLSKKDLPISKEVFGATANELYQHAVKSGVIDPTMLEPKPLFNRKILSTTTKYTSGFLTRSSEQAARFAFFSAMYRYLRQGDKGKNIPVEKTMQDAARLTETYMVDYSTDAKPRAFTGSIMGELAGRLQSFKMNQLSQVYRYGKLAKDTGNPLPLVTMLGLMFATTGIIGMIGFDIADKLYNTFIKDDDDPNTLKGKVIQNVPEVYVVGPLSHYTGLSLFNAFSSTIIGDATWKNAIPILSAVPEQFAAAGKIGGALTGLGPSFEEMTNPELARSILAFTPSSARNLVEENLLDEKGTVRSSYTGLPLYEKKEGDRRLQNIQPLSRGITSTAKSTYRKETLAIGENKKKKLKEVTDLAVDLYSYGKYNDAKAKRYIKAKSDYMTKFGGESKELEQALVSASIPDPLVRDIMGDVNLSNMKQKLNALRYQDVINRRQ